MPRLCFRKQCCQICTLILILLQISLSVCFSIDNPQNMRNDCREMTTTSKCECSLGPSDFEIYCPAHAEKPKISMNINAERRHVQIECNQLKTQEYFLMPQMSIGNTSAVQIKYCSLPGIDPIVSILNRLGIKHLSTLLFEINNLEVNLTRNHLRGLENLNRLRFKTQGLSYLPEDLFEDMRNLTWLDLVSGTIEFTPNIFVPLENLNYLELGNNNLHNLPPGIFRKQRKLRHLNFRSNQLKNLTREVFLGLSSLEDLDLSSNGIQSFQPNVFELLTKINDINLNGNNFVQLPVGLFAYNDNLTQFRMINNRVQLPELPSGLLANKSQLRDLRITCDLMVIPGNIFANSTSITNISLANNKLQTLPPDLLANQYELLDLDLRKNKLQSLPNELFSATSKLLVLNLSVNQLTKISSDVFAPLINLKVLVLNNNHIKSIHADAFIRTQNLNVLNMENNEIDFSDQEPMTGSPFQSLIKLQVLNLRNNSVMYIFNDWKFNLLRLHELDLSYNNITSFSDNDLQFLSERNVNINLSHNQLRNIIFETIHEQDVPRSILTFNVGSNPINCNCMLLKFVQFLHKEIATNLTNIILQTDDMVCNSPKNLMGRPMNNVKPMDLLCSLDSENTKKKLCPSGCDCKIRSYDSLLIVNCSNSNYTKVPNLPRLEHYNSTELYIENNQLTELPRRNMPGYANVTRLHAARNNISKLELNNLPIYLTHLDLSFNQFKTLNSSTLAFLNASGFMNTLKLSNNPWECSCATKDFLQFVQRNPILADFDEMRCSLGEEDMVEFKELTLSDICPVEKELIIILAVLISLIGFLIGLTAALYYKYQQEIKVWLYAHNMCLCFVSEEELDKDKKFDGFISYSHKDEDFVADELVRDLEKGPMPYKLCIHARDWIVGEYIPEQIVRSVDESRRTIVVLSQNFLESIWARMEFRTAHQQALTEKRVRVIVILYGEVDVTKLDNELQAYLKMNTYLKWGDPWFWKKLHYAMPHRNSRKLNGMMKTALKGSTDDKLELIKPSPVTPPLTTPPSEATKNPLVAHLNGGTPQTAVMIPNGKMGGLPNYYANGKTTNGHINGAFIINTNAKQSDV